LELRPDQVGKLNIVFIITSMDDISHSIRIDAPVLLPQDGLLLGNGDLSVSAYQSAGEIRFRFGKVDVWDRRIDFSRDAAPAHIEEVRRGIELEGWPSTILRSVSAKLHTAFSG